MEHEYAAYIKVTRKGKFRGVIGTLHDVGEPDGDRSIFTTHESEISDDLDALIVDMKEQCANCGITKISLTPIKASQLVWESQLG